MSKTNEFIECIDSSDYKILQDTSLLSVLTKKEICTSQILEKIVVDLLKNKPDHQSNDEFEQNLQTIINSLLQSAPLLFGHKYSNVIKQAVLAKQNELNLKNLVDVPLKQHTLLDYCLRYKFAFKCWIDNSEDVVFATTNPTVLEKIELLSLKELFILHLFVFATCKRKKSDQILMLIISGKSTVGKSCFVENPLSSITTSLCTENGIGRFNCAGKSVLLLHDVHPSILISSKDSDRIRTLCRSENTTVKIFGSVQTVEPIFLMMTSNQNVHQHVLKNAFNLTQKIESVLLEKKNAKKLLLKESITAIQNRSLEVYFLRRPLIHPDFFPDEGTTFSRNHLIFGIYETVLTIIEKHQDPTVYFSKMIFYYCVYSLLHHLNEYCTLFHVEEERKMYILSMLNELKNK